MATKAIRVMAPNVRNGSGTIQIPYIYTGETIRKLQEEITEGVWMLGYKYDKSTDAENSFGIFMQQLELFERLGWVTDIHWIGAYLCLFRDNCGSWFNTIIAEVNQLKGWFCYNPSATWKPLNPALS